MKGYFIGWVFVMALCMAIIPNKHISADTNVSGYISADTTWTSANSPYVVTGNIVVKSGVALTIEPGVTVKTDSGKSIQVDGTLIAKGTSASKITFTKNSSSNWGYILFSDSSTDAEYDTGENYTSGSILEYCAVEYAGGGASVSDNGAVRINGAHPLINYCTIKNNSASGIYAWNLSDGTLKITNNTISNNSASNGGGIYSSSPSPASLANYSTTTTVSISGNTISNNSASNGGGIYSSSNSFYSTVSISGNTISNNTASSDGGGIYYSSSTSNSTTIVSISGNTISNNSASNGGGIYSYSSVYIYNYVFISGNTISNNTASSYGGGINFNENSSTSSVSISGNIISNNTASHGGGIYSYSSPYYTTVTISGNTIYNNTASSDGGGIYSYSYSYSEQAYYITISGNTISNNTASSSGGGIYTSGASATVSKNGLTMNAAKNASAYYNSSDYNNFTYNTIMGNKATDSSNTYTVYISSNLNYNNIFSNTATYELWNGNAVGSSNLDAKNNWWGTTDDSTIQGKIYDWIDDTTKGLVDYSPFETTLRTDCPISPPTGLTATAGSGQITLNWSANSESDTNGYKVYWDTDSGHSYANAADAGNVTSYTITSLVDGKYYVTVTAYDTSYSSASDDTSTVVNENQTSGNESWYAEEKSVTLGATPTPSPTPTPTATPSPSPSPAVSPTPTPSSSGCDGKVKTVETDTGDFELLKRASEVVTVTVIDAGGCPVTDKKVSAKVNVAGKKSIKISSSSETTDENGEAAFTITAKKKTGNAKVTFKAVNIKKKITVTVVSE